MNGLSGTMKTAGYNLKQPPVHELTDFRTPLAKVFSVHHMGIPRIDPAAWRLVVAGLVEREILLSLADLETLPQTEVAAFHECAGSPLRPTEPVRRVANVLWRGVRLGEVLDRAGIKLEATYLWSYGLDHGEFNQVVSPCYLKDLPIEETRRDNVLLATHINDEKIPDPHGGPVRLVVPGFYGTNSTKWLSRLEARDIRSPGYFTTVLYNDRIVANGQETARPVWKIAPHSIIVAPAAGTVLPQTAQRLWGWAWGAETIARVEVSDDGGSTWHNAHLAARDSFSWQRFEWDWTPSQSGPHTLCCRATDRTGSGQPDNGARNEVFRLPVSVT